MSTLGGVTFAGSGLWKNTGVLAVNPGLTVQGGSNFVNDGTVNVVLSLTLSGATASMTNNGTLVLVGPASMLSSGLLTNNGTVRKTGTGTAPIHTRVAGGSGAYEVQGGVLAQHGSSAFGAASLSVSNGAVLRFDTPTSAPFSHSLNGPSVSGAGDVVVDTITFLPTPPLTINDDTSFDLSGPSGLHLKAGNLKLSSTGVLRNLNRLLWGNYRADGPGEVVNETGGVVTIDPTVGQGAVLAGDVVVRNRGTLTVANGITLNSATLENEPTGWIDLWYEGIGAVAGSNSAVVNRGTLRFPDPLVPGSITPVGSVSARYEQRDAGKTRVERQILFLTRGGEFGAGGGRFEVGQAAGPTWGSLVFAEGAFNVTAPGHVITGQSGSATIEGAGTVMNIGIGGELTLDVRDPSSALASRVFLDSGAQLGGPGLARNIGAFGWEGQVGVAGVADFRNEPPGIVSILGAAKLRGIFTNDASVIQPGDLDMANSTVHNHGVWAIGAQDNSAFVSGTNALFRNLGQLLVGPAPAPPNYNAFMSVSLDNLGVVSAHSVDLFLTGNVLQLQGTTLAGGTWEVANGGRIIFPTGSITRIAGAVVRGGTAGIPAVGSVSEIDGGELHATDDVQVNGSLKIKNNGRLLVGPGADMVVPDGVTVGDPPTASAAAYCAQDLAIQAQPDPPRLITPTLTNHGHIRPGGPGAPGPFNLVGNLVQLGLGRVQIEIRGLVPEDEFDRVSITGAAALAGVLDVSLLAPFVPSVGDEFVILTASAGVTGQFAQVVPPPTLPGALALTTVYAPGSVTLRVDPACYPDCNADSTLNLADFGCFQTKFALQNSYADCNGDSLLNIADFGCFQTRFALGCR